MRYYHEFSLRKRLKEILEKLGDIASMLIQEMDKFIDDVVNTRNFLTHYDKTLKEKSRGGHELYKISEQLRFIVEVCMLTELEMENDKIKKLLSCNRIFQHIMKL